MRKITFLLSFVFLSFFWAPSFSAQLENEPSIWEKRFDLSAGLRRDKFTWNIAGDINGASPNILSELSWNNLRIFQVKTEAKVIFDKRLRVEGSYGFGLIYRGDNQDSDYNGDNRTFEFSRSNNKTDEDNVSDWSAGLGYQFNLADADYLYGHKAALTILAGYSEHKQNLKITNGFQTIDTVNYTYGPFDGLNSKYQAEWKGPWLGTEFETAKGKITGLLRIEYHWADYFAEADWNLRDDFAHPVSYTHTADGKGTIVSLGLGYNIKTNWLVFLRTDFQDWETDKGVDRTFFSDGVSIDTQLNRVEWNSTAIILGVRCRI